MKTIQNPILRGFCPDPCMIRTGDDYYIATSTFEWWPCVNLYHSKDLAHWEQLPSPLREPGQMDLRGDPNSGGIWGAKLKYAGWDAIIVEGEAPDWTYINIDDDKIELLDAREYVGVMSEAIDEQLLPLAQYSL